MAGKCGAKTRAGGKCRAPAMKNGKCRVHGGASTGAPPDNTNAVKAGSLYSKYLTHEEQAEYAQMELGLVDDELRLMRIRLARALRLEKESTKPELETEITREGGGPSTVGKEVHYKKRDYISIINQITTRIESLERTRAELLKKGTGEELPVLPVKVIIQVEDASLPES